MGQAGISFLILRFAKRNNLILRMAIDCRIANRLIAICSDRLAGSSYQNTQIFDKLSLLIVINNTKGDILFMCD